MKDSTLKLKSFFYDGFFCLFVSTWVHGCLFRICFEASVFSLRYECMR